MNRYIFVIQEKLSGITWKVFVIDISEKSAGFRAIENLSYNIGCNKNDLSINTYKQL